MKKVLLLAMIFLPISSLLATNNLARQYLGFSVGSGYSNIDLFKQHTDLITKGMFGFDAEFAYEYQNSHIEGMWLSAKFGIQLMTSRSVFNGLQDFTLRINDTRGIETNCHYKDFGPLKENQSIFAFSPMFQIGYHENDFYFGVGVKPMFDLFFSATSTAYVTTATYDQYIDDFENMDDHYYTYHDVKNSEGIKSKFGGGGLLSFEIGGYYKNDKYSGGGKGKHTSDIQLVKLAAFVESGAIWYGSWESQGYKPLNGMDGKSLYFETPTIYSDVTELKPLSYYQVNNSSSRLFVPFYAGVRLTVLFNFYETCVGCSYKGKSVKNNYVL